MSDNTVTKGLYPVTVIMSTYNGHQYVEAQLDSIFAQEGVIIHLIVRDDGSSDDTREILSAYAEKINAAGTHTMKCIWGKNVGSCESFLELIYDNYEGEYFSLADQDDVWDKDKLICAIRYMHEHADVEKKPVLYVSNLRIVDENLNYLRNNREDKPPTNKYNSFFEKWVTGCTAVYNRKLAALLHVYKPHHVIMHDSWVGLLGYQLGVFLYDIEPHMSYRQHGGNVMGASTEQSAAGKLRRAVTRLQKELADEHHYAEYSAKEFVEHYYMYMTKSQLERAMAVANYREDLASRVKLLTDKRYRLKPYSHDLKKSLMILLGKI